MKLSLLRARLMRFEAPRSFVRVETVAEADCVFLLCPACFRKNGGPVGTHGIRVDFLGRGVPADVCIHNDQGQPVWWSAQGTTIEDLTTNPSILIRGGVCMARMDQGRTGGGRMTEHIRQRGGHDCGVASIAMAVGCSYEDAFREARASKQFYPRKGMYSVGTILERFGYHWENLGRHKDHPAPNPDGPQFRSIYLRDQVLHPKYLARFFWGRPAILSIVSLNHPPDGRHLVFFDGERVLDPQEGRRGKRWATKLEQIEICEAWVWDHR